MTYRQHSAALAHYLLALVASGGSENLDEDGLKVALLGRNQTLRLIQRALTTATGASPVLGGIRTAATSQASATASRRTVDEAYTNPVIVLQHVLARYPRPAVNISFMDVRAEHLTSPAAEHWHAVARTAIIAGHELDNERSAYRHPHRKWGLVADAAALTPVLQALDLELLGAARRIYPEPDGRRPSRPGAVELLTVTQHSSASFMAAEVNAIAHTGPLTSPSALETPPASTRPVAVTSPAALLEAQRRLAAQLTTAEDVRPQVVATVAAGQGLLLAAAADRLDRAGQHGHTSDLARDLAGHLARAVSPSVGDVTALVPGTRAPLIQTQLMLDFLATPQQITELDRGDLLALRATVHQSPAVLAQLSRAADRQLSSGRWLISYSEHTPYTWDRARANDDEPRLASALRRITQVFPAHEYTLPVREGTPTPRNIIPPITRSPRARPAVPRLAVAKNHADSGGISR
ncbi:hypothetical protein [Georgenia muralis]|uniref:Uncharacterized protein n=1 Tax=Georgenia muralis TaxID=154117 RepID=A0A3N4Z991_9MICO|nr:hypothetical protein [Georgenia muralis]RPF28604.1 hypothetical protein EDD32_3137 [Georgenia muralis]